MKVPFAKPCLGEEEIAEVVDTLRSGWLGPGPRTRRFEEEFASYVGAPFAVGTSSCTGALHVALVALGLGTGDEVVTSTMTFAATANVIVHAGARPVFVDVDPATLNMDVAEVKRSLSPRTRAVIAVHYAGRMCAVGALRALCDARGLKLVEDCAHATGARSLDRAAGAWGDAAGFSFYANKNLTTGEGGMLTTADASLAARARVLRLQGMTRDTFQRAEGSAPRWRYEIVAAGFKYSMSDLQAAIGLHQLKRQPGFLEDRRRLVARYAAALGRIAGLELPPPEAPGEVHAWHLFVVRVKRDARRTRDEVYDGLAPRGVEASVHFVPLHLQPYFQETWGYRPGMFPRAEQAFEEILSLPLYPTMSDAEQDQVIEALTELL